MKACFEATQNTVNTATITCTLLGVFLLLHGINRDLAVSQPHFLGAWRSPISYQQYYATLIARVLIVT